MSISAYLICRSQQITIALGKPLRRPDGTVIDFGHGHIQGAERAQLDRALWKFLADTAGEQLVVARSGDVDFETSAGWPMIGGDAEDGNIPLHEYLGEAPADEDGRYGAYTYFGSVRLGQDRTDIGSVFRRRIAEGHPLDETYSSSREWLSTTLLRERESGQDDFEIFEITEAEAEAVVRRRSDPPTVGDPIA